ncbi:LysR family transcriptional regulator [Subtercola frigoramans]|uniref:DNA-binding transcriptional LysR family regulator n=1 Tax=Subtercola frigoramans TaxID=120298 RepID=A0ABS2L135_9MICO|nr:LysR family transcriptional regulator [Subtercola frigoramans]MBM7470661.1 DNA-binding transcriptional LysR family regulator [Subtercola frigoramans]
MEVPIHVIKYFCTLADELHFGKAAASLGIATPSLSQQVSKLEASLGTKLFERNSRQVSLTSAGLELLPLARRVRDDHDHLLAWADRQQRNVDGRLLRIGMVAAGAGPLTTRILAAAVDKLPAMRIEMRRIGFFDTSNELLEGRVDVVFAPAPMHMDDRILAEPLWREPRVLVVPDGHRLAARESIGIMECAEDVFVSASGGAPDIIDWWLADPRPDGSHPLRGPVADDFEGLIELVAARVGVNIASFGASQQFRRDGVSFVRITDIEPATILLCCLKRQVNPEVAAFMALGAELARAFASSRIADNSY